MERKYKKAVYLGRFQPFHLGHMHVIEEALKIADKVHIIIGSINKPPSSKNPFNYHQRYGMIWRALIDAGYDGRFIIQGQKDYDYNESKWISEINSKVVVENNDTCIIGHSKDESSYYLKNFPKFKSEEVENYNKINATDIRRLMYYGFSSWNNKTPNTIWRTIQNLILSPQFKLASEDFDADEKAKNEWKDSPYPPMFITGDAVAIQSGNVLIIKRKFAPGKGLWAIPGGYMEQGETIDDCIIRELYEETNINIQESIIRRTMDCPKVYDAPSRSGRGRIVTHASLIRLDDSKPLPRVRGGDDADKAWWVPIEDLSQHDMFEDHYHIIMDLIGQ